MEAPDCPELGGVIGTPLTMVGGLTGSPTELMARIGADPETVDHVVLSHMHWGHIGNVALLPNATFSMAYRDSTSGRVSMPNLRASRSRSAAQNSGRSRSSNGKGGASSSRKPPTRCTRASG
ncbi:MBL fold metallo-hydrolase [Streptomyces sp. NPDC055006]